jgi:hypothetical protein
MIMAQNFVIHVDLHVLFVIPFMIVYNASYHTHLTEFFLTILLA